MADYKTINDIDVAGKVIFARFDYNVPIVDGKITDDTRIVLSKPTLDAMKTAKQINIWTHMDRPQKQFKKIDTLDISESEKEAKRQEVIAKNSTNQIVARLAAEVGEPVAFFDEYSSVYTGPERWVVRPNTRLDRGEEKNSPEFAHMIAKGDVFMQDAFGCCHRVHATTYAVPEIFKKDGKPVVAGLLLDKEEKMLDKLLNVEEDARPYVAILGGVKVSDKIGVIESLMDYVDSILIGGAMAYTFLKYKGISVGSSLVEDEIKVSKDETRSAKEVLDAIYQKAADKGVDILLPIDHGITEDPIDDIRNLAYTNGQVINAGKGVDIGDKTLELYKKTIMAAKTILWNGPMGVFEQEKSANGTIQLAKIVAEATELGAFSVVGGGDSVKALNDFGYVDKISHVSTGGGASLERITTRGNLPGVVVIKYREGGHVL